jgi:hypothetical protein
LANVQLWLSSCVPSQTAGAVETTVRVWLPSDLHAPQPEYSYLQAGTQACVSTGGGASLQLSGDSVTVRVCVPSSWHVPHSEYVYWHGLQAANPMVNPTAHAIRFM